MVHKSIWKDYTKKKNKISVLIHILFSVSDSEYTMENYIHVTDRM